MNQEELMKILPHRRSMLLVEEATVEDGKAHGKYHVRGDEWFLDGHPVRPGDTYETECTILKSKGPFYFCQGRGSVNGKLCVQADFSFALIKKG